MKYLNKLTEIYSPIDDFHKQFNQSIQKYQFKLSVSEVMTLLNLFPPGHFKNRKRIYFTIIIQYVELTLF